MMSATCVSSKTVREQLRERKGEDMGTVEEVIRLLRLVTRTIGAGRAPIPAWTTRRHVAALWRESGAPGAATAEVVAATHHTIRWEVVAAA
jgi:hypothetical protein